MSLAGDRLSLGSEHELQEDRVSSNNSSHKLQKKLTSHRRRLMRLCEQNHAVEVLSTLHGLHITDPCQLRCMPNTQLLQTFQDTIIMLEQYFCGCLAQGEAEDSLSCLIFCCLHAFRAALAGCKDRRVG